MTTPRSTPWPAGAPCWLDLMAPDVAEAGRFYGAVLGWDVAEPDEAYGGYVMASVDGADAAGIGPVMEGARTGWTLYFASDDCDATAAQITGHGGQLHLPPMDVGPLGRMLIAGDPTGATFGVWQAGSHLGAGHVNAPGGLVWEDLRSTDPDAARAFYSAVFGLRSALVGQGVADRATLHLGDDDAPVGGIGGQDDGDTGPSRWVLTFCVADIDAAVQAATAGGGAVTTPAFLTPYGAMAGLEDPAGKEFWIGEVSVEEQRDAGG